MTPDEIYYLMRLLEEAASKDDATALQAVRDANDLLGDHGLELADIVTAGHEAIDHSDWPEREAISRDLVSLLWAKGSLPERQAARLDYFCFIIDYRRLTQPEIATIRAMRRSAAQ